MEVKRRRTVENAEDIGRLFSTVLLVGYVGCCYVGELFASCKYNAKLSKVTIGGGRFLYQCTMKLER